MTSSVYVESLKNPSPFASKKIMRQRNHHSGGNEPEHNLGDGEIQVVPGSREEIMEFVENTNANAKVFLDIIVPNLFVTLPSKHLYEIIYNRFVIPIFYVNSIKQIFKLHILFLDLQMIYSFGLRHFLLLHPGEMIQCDYQIYWIELVILHLVNLEYILVNLNYVI